MYNLLEELVTNPTQSKDHPELNVIAGIFKNKLGIIDTNLLIVKKYINKLIITFKGIANSIIDLINYTITTIVNAVKFIFGIQRSTAAIRAGGQSLGFWTFWGVTGAFLTKMCLKIYLYLKTKNEQCLKTKLISNQSIILKEIEEPNVVVSKIINSGEDSAKELKEQLVTDKEIKKSRSFFSYFVTWVLGVLCCVLFIFASLNYMVEHPKNTITWTGKFIDWYVDDEWQKSRQGLWPW